jgi:succinate dehydrogenase / fumarate reductase flavoprotein subunit
VTDLNARVPEGPIEQKWDRCVQGLCLVSPTNRRRYEVLVVGAGLAGCSLAFSLAEQGYRVKVLTILDSPRRSHSVAAQGGINAAKNFPNDGDSVYRMFGDTLRGGDFRAREANVYRLAQLSNAVLDHTVALGVPYAREYGGGLVNRSFGGVQVSRTFYARGQTGQQLLNAAHGSLMRQVASGRVALLCRREMLDLVVHGGRARGVISRNLLTGEIESHQADLIAIASGGYSSVYYLSSNAIGSNATAIWRCHRRGAFMANPSLMQFHPTCLPEVAPTQSKLTLMSEGLRNDGRVWVPKRPDDTRSPGEIPEAERDYYLERLYPNYGNLVPRDIASREALAICQTGHGVGATRRAVYLDFRDTPKDQLTARYGNLFDMYEEITGEDPYRTPMRIFPAAHFSMGGLWVDYHLRTNIRGLFALGEANCSDHGANRLGANSLLQTLVDGLFIAPLTVADELAHFGPAQPDGSLDQALEAARQRAREETGAWLGLGGQRSPRDFHRALGEVLRDQVGVKRDAAGLNQALLTVRQLRQDFATDLRVVGQAEGLNGQLEQAGRTRDYLELGELMALDALHRQECCGAHFRTDLPEQRDDERFAYVAAWQWSGDPSSPILHKESLSFEEMQPVKRSY